jgi:hypothetical protein
MKTKARAKGCECMDCGFDIGSEPGHYYMLQADLWASINPRIEGMLCIPCLERRLGRKVCDDDLQSLPLKCLNGCCAS